jgi:hypothetical protein
MSGLTMPDGWSLDRLDYLDKLDDFLSRQWKVLTAGDPDFEDDEAYSLFMFDVSGWERPPEADEHDARMVRARNLYDRSSGGVR